MLHIIGSLAGWLIMGLLLSWARHSLDRSGRPAAILAGLIGAAAGFGLSISAAIAFGQHLSDVGNILVLVLILASVFLGFLSFAAAANKLGW